MKADKTLACPQFAALMYEIFKRCYHDQIERVGMLRGNAKYLFGYELDSKELADMSISKKMEKALNTTVNGRAIENFCKTYNRTDKATGTISLSTHFYTQYLNFTDLNDATLESLTHELTTRYGADFPPADILRWPSEPANPPETGAAAPAPQPAKYAVNIHAFTRSNWFFYFYEYQAPKPRLIRLVMKFEQTDNTYSVHIVNTSEKYATYKGEIKEMTERILRIELTGQKSRTMNIMVNMDPSGDSEIYMGKFMKNSSGLVSCSVVLQRVPDSEQNPKAETFDYGEPPIDASVPQPIQDFFEKREWVYTKVTHLYSLEKLDAWLKSKQKDREEDIVRHVFITAPVGAYHDQNEIVNQLKQEVVTVFHNLEQTDLPALQNLRKQIEGLLQEKLLGSIYPIAHKADNFKDDVFALQDAIEKKFSIETYFAPRNNDYYYRSYKTNLQEEWRQLRRSQALLMIVPARPLFSSCWVILGWAMARKMPIFLLCHGEDGLPYMVRSPEHHDNVVQIPLSTLHHYSLANAPEALDNNTKWQKLVHKSIRS
jgi:hypothetical protein